MKAAGVLLPWLLAIVLLGWRAPAAAQSAQASSSSIERTSAAPAPPAAASGQPLRPSHPTQTTAAALTDRCAPSTEVAPRNVSVLVLDMQGRPVAGASVALLPLAATEAPGGARTEQRGRSAANGRVLLSAPASGAQPQYQVAVRHQAAEYRSTPFFMHPALGQDVRLHVFPVTRDLAKAQVTLRALVYLAVQQQLVHFDILLQAFNPGRLAAICEDLRVGLPRGSQGFSTKKISTQLRLVSLEPQALKLQGTVTPGQHELSFSFEVPSSGQASASFDLSLPPRTTEVHVATTATSRLRLAVAGFPPAERADTPHGQRLLTTASRLPASSQPVPPLIITLTGLPTESSARYVVVALALFLALGGVVAAWSTRSRRGNSSEQITQQRRAARELLLAELVALHAARQRAEVGPEAFARARTILIDAIARLELDRAGRSTDRVAGWRLE